MQLKELISHLERVAPPVHQESYDNAGLITGSPDMDVRGILVCLDSTEAVIEEAITKNCNVVVAHHPIIFRGLKRLTGRTYVERVVIKAIRAGIAIYAIHTNLDNVLYRGVNSKIADRLGLVNTSVLAPKSNLLRLSAILPASQLTECRSALEAAGIREICARRMQIEEEKCESLGLVDSAYVHLSALITSADERNAGAILQRFDVREGLSCHLHEVKNANVKVGSGLIGALPEPLPENDFLFLLKERMQTDCIRHTALVGRPVQRVALCGGAGSFLLPMAITQKADIFITADYKYHEFFDAEGQIIIADIGHYESEQFTIELLSEIILEKFRNFAVHCTGVRTNPVHYYVG